MVNVRRFTEVAIGGGDWIEILKALGGVRLPQGWKSLFNRLTGDAAAWQDAERLVDSVVEQVAIQSAEGSVPARLPLIVCFSGRDGFRSTSFSLSAPLEVISGGNAYGWTPITLTHEICHVWITGFLSTIFPDPNDSNELERMTEIQNDTGVKNVLDDLRVAMCMSYHLLDLEADKTPFERSGFRSHGMTGSAARSTGQRDADSHPRLPVFLQSGRGQLHRVDLVQLGCHSQH